MALPHAFTEHASAARCARLALSASNSARRCVEGARSLRSSPRFVLGLRSCTLGLPRARHLIGTGAMPPAAMRATRPNVHRTAGRSCDARLAKCGPHRALRWHTRPNPAFETDALQPASPSAARGSMQTLGRSAVHASNVCLLCLLASVVHIEIMELWHGRCAACVAPSTDRGNEATARCLPTPSAEPSGAAASLPSTQVTFKLRLRRATSGAFVVGSA